MRFVIIIKGGVIMPKVEQKQVVVNEIKEKVAKAKSIVIVDARGLSVEQDTVLRKKLRDNGVDYKVYKNTMVNFAIEGSEFEGLKEYLAGPSAFAFSYDDPMLAAKLIEKELKGMPKLEFKAGYIDGTVYDAEGVKAIANIPSREELLSKLLGSFKSPLSSFARVVNAIAEQKGEDAGESA
jgi:large subunit ribosomal protein L10